VIATCVATGDLDGARVLVEAVFVATAGRARRHDLSRIVALA
jgi:hypothetical protein